MNEVKTSKLETMFSLSGIKNSAATFIKDSFSQIEKILPFKSATDKEPVDNYLKSPEEMEADFSFVLNRGNEFAGRDERQDFFGKPLNNTDGYLNIVNTDQPSGFMEENY